MRPVSSGRIQECHLKPEMGDEGRSEVVMPTFGCHDPAGTRIGTRKLLDRR
jgi:hypothetical protein